MTRPHNKNAFETMDRMYRVQRYFYDVTRKYYLLGRDQLLQRIDPQPNERILEIGCGTGRNLIKLASECPTANLFGLDASAAMLETAQTKTDTAGIANITYRNALADDFNFQTTFGIERPFDKVFFSYSISMIPTWRESIENALNNLGTGGSLFIVDFYDQKELPIVFQRLLKWWLSKFHVQFWPELIPYLDSLKKSRDYDVTIAPLYRHYSFIATVRASDQ